MAKVVATPQVRPALPCWYWPDPALPLDLRFFHALCLLGGLVSLFVVVPVDLLQHLVPWVNRGVIGFGLTSLALAWAASRGRYFKKTLVLALVLCLDCVWFPNGGSTGSIGMFYFIPTLYLVLFFKGRFRFLGVALVLVNVIALRAAELARPGLVSHFLTPMDRFLDFATTYLISLLVCALFLWVIVEGFNKEKARNAASLEALRASEALHRLLADNVADVIWTMDLEGRLTYVSPSVERLRGMTPAQARAQTLEEIMAPGSLPAVQRAYMAGVEAAAQGKDLPEYRDVVEQRCQDGSTVWVELTASGMRDEDGKIIGVLGVTRDVSERTRIQAEHDRLEDQMRQMEKMECLGTLAGGVAHDMNNVLGAILGLASVHLHKAEPRSSLARDMTTVTKACQRGSALVKGLLGFARKGLAEEVELDLNEVIREEVALLARTTLQRVRLVTDLAGDLRPMVGDPSAMSHALMNLCVNAVDAMPEGGTLTLRTRNDDDHRVILEVADSGCGMPPEVLAKAMDPFFTTKGRGKGTGLGLAIVFTTVKTHRGTLELRSEPGAGTCITLRFPACMKGREAAEPGLEQAFQPASGPLKVLLVDDDELIREAVKEILGEMGHHATVAPGGEAALLELENGLEPDVVILDMNMPDLDGSQTLPRLRGLCPGVPVLLATGGLDDRALELMASYPGVTLLAKPFSILELQRRLEKAAAEPSRLES